MPGRTIRIFLVDGISSGLRTAELSNSTIKSVVVPRASLSIAAKRSELQKTGVYVLVGPNPDVVGQKIAYVGEGDSIITRLTKHDKDPDKEFWEEAIAFVSKDENLTKSHSRYLEARLISLALDARRTKLANGTNPTDAGKLPEADQAEMEEFILQAKLLLGTLGYDIFEQGMLVTLSQSQPSSTKQLAPSVFEMEGDDYKAECQVDVDAGQFIIKKGALAKIKEVNALPASTKAKRSELVSSGVLVKHNEKSWVFVQDYSFSSVSSAVQTVAGSTINGKVVLKNSLNQTYGDWQTEITKTISEESQEKPNI